MLPMDNSAGDMLTPAQTEPVPPAGPVPLFLRYGAASLVTAGIDNLVFYFVFHSTGTIAGAQAVARIVSVLFNYGIVRRIVFSSGQNHRHALPRYLLLVALNALISYTGIRVLSSLTPLGVVPSKILSESLLFVANFAIQRRFVFQHRHSSQPNGL